MIAVLNCLRRFCTGEKKKEVGIIELLLSTGEGIMEEFPIAGDVWKEDGRIEMIRYDDRIYWN